MVFSFVSGRLCLDFAGTFKHRETAPADLLTRPGLLSDWAVAAGLLDSGIAVTDDELRAAIDLREAIYRVLTARLSGGRPALADAELLNTLASQPQLTPHLDRTGAAHRGGTAPQLLARLSADLLELVAGTDIDRVKCCIQDGCTRLYVDASRAQNRNWCGMGTCGNRAKVQAFRARQRAVGGQR